MSEFKRIIKSKSIIISIIVLLFSIISINLVFVTQTFYAEESVVAKNIDDDEVEEKLDFLNNLLEDDSLSNKRINEIKEEIATYKCIYDNGLSKNDYRIIENVPLFENNSYSYSFFIINLLLITCSVILIFVINETYNSDFLYGTYKYVYTRNKTRLNIIKSKCISSLIITGCMVLISIITTVIIGLFFSMNYKYIIVPSLNPSLLEVKSLMVSLYCFFMIDILFYFIVFTFVSLFSKSFIRNLIIDFSIFFFIYLIIYYSNIGWINILFANGERILELGYSLTEVLIGYSIRFIVAISAFIFSLVYFKKKNLC